MGGGCWRANKENPSHLVATKPSSWDSSQTLYHFYLCGKSGWQCYSCFWSRPAWRSRSSSSSGLSRLRPRLSGGRSGMWIGSQDQMQWILMTGSTPPPLLSSLFPPGCLGSCQGSLVRWLHLQSFNVKTTWRPNLQLLWQFEIWTCEKRKWALLESDIQTHWH